MNRFLEVVTLFLLFYFELGGLWFFIILFVDSVLKSLFLRKWLAKIYLVGSLLISVFAFYLAINFG